MGQKERLIRRAFDFVPMGCPNIQIGMDDLDLVPELDVIPGPKEQPTVYCKSYDDNNPVCLLCPLAQGIVFNDTNPN